MPFGNNCEFADFSACVQMMEGKVDNPEGFCAVLMQETEDACAGGGGAKVKLAAVAPGMLDGVETRELAVLHGRMHQLFADVNTVDVVVNAHHFIVKEMAERDLTHDVHRGLDSVELTEQLVGPPVGPNPSIETDVVMVPDYVAVVGSAARDLENANDLDILVREEDEVPTAFKESLYVLLRQRFDPEKTGKELHLLFNPQGPRHGDYVPVYDLILRRSTGERRLVKSAPVRLTLLGVGVANSRMFAPAGLLIESGQHRVMLDGGPGAVPRGDLDAWLVTDRHGDLFAKIKDLAEERGVLPEVRSFYRDGLEVVPRPVKHLSYDTFGYAVKVGGKSVVWAPSFAEFPRWASGADVMFAEASVWDRSVRRVAKETDPLDVVSVAREAQEAGVRRLVFSHIGRPTVRALAAERQGEIGFGEFGDVGQAYVLRQSLVARTARRLMKSHSREACMTCTEVPNVDILWAEGMARAWFCYSCFHAWEKENPDEVVALHRLSQGAAPASFEKATPTVTGRPSSVEIGKRQLHFTRPETNAHIWEAESEVGPGTGEEPWDAWIDPDGIIQRNEARNDDAGEARIVASLYDDPFSENDDVYGIRVQKASPDKRYTFGVMYKATLKKTDPELDAHDEFVMADLLQTAQWQYVRRGNRNIYLQHSQLAHTVIGEWVDIVSWPYEQTVDLVLPDRAPVRTTIPAGSVWMGVVWTPQGWDLVKRGLIRGFSMGGFASRQKDA